MNGKYCRTTSKANEGAWKQKQRRKSKDRAIHAVKIQFNGSRNANLKEHLRSLASNLIDKSNIIFV